MGVLPLFLTTLKFVCSTLALSMHYNIFTSKLTEPNLTLCYGVIVNGKRE